MQKRDRIELDRRREISRRVRFLKNRMRDMPIELSFATGKRATLPKNLAMPPDWALASARLASDGMNKPIEHLKPIKGRQYQPADLIELLGFYQSIVCYVNNPPKDMQEQQSDVPELRSVWAPLEKKVTRGFQKFILRLQRLTKIKYEIPSSKQLIEVNERFGKGLGEFASADGEIRGLHSVSARLYYLIWMFWSHLEKRFNAPYIHSWFKRDFGEATSDKTVEAVVTRLRKEAIAREQP